MRQLDAYDPTPLDGDLHDSHSIEPDAIYDALEPRPALLWGMVPRSPAMLVAAAYIFVVVIRPWEVLFPWLQAIKFERVFVLGAVGLIASTRGFRLRADLPTLAVFTQLAVVAICASTAVRPALAWTGSGSAYEYLSLVLFFVSIVSVVRVPYEFGFLVGVWGVAQGAYWCKAQWEFWLHGAGRTSMDVMRITGIDETGRHPNSFATMLVASLPLMVLIYTNAPVLTASWPRGMARRLRPVTLLVGCVGVISLVMTNSRAGLVALVALVMFAIFRNRSPSQILKICLLVAAVAVVGWLVLPAETQARYLSILDSSASNASAQESADSRVDGFVMGLEMWRRFPIMGVGPGNFRAYRVQFLDGVDLASHNLLAEVVAQSGVLGAGGLLLLLLALWSATSRMKRLSRHQRDPAVELYGRLAVAIRFGLAGLLIMGMANHNFFRIEWVWFAALCSLGPRFLRQRLRDIEADAMAARPTPSPAALQRELG